MFTILTTILIALIGCSLFSLPAAVRQRAWSVVMILVVDLGIAGVALFVLYRLNSLGVWK